MANTSATQEVADYLLASKRCEILGLDHLLHMGRLVAAVSDLVHALQQERGLSNLHVASRGERAGERLARRVEETRDREQAFRERLAELDTQRLCSPGFVRLFARIAYALHGLDELRAVRREIRGLKLSPEAIIEGYSELVRGLLAVVFEAADAAADPDISRVLVAMFHLMQGKELAGQERAVGAAGFARGGFDEPLSGRLQQLIDHQERCFQIFMEFADSRSLDAWRGAISREAMTTLERFRRIAFASVQEGQAEQSLCDDWFELTTARINAIKEVEDRLEVALTELCARKLEDARADLDKHRIELDTLVEQPGPGSFAIFYDPPADAPPVEETYDAGCASPRLGRSLIDLVQSQSLRLHEMGEQLREAQAALEERKSIEKAKGLIMTHRDMTEDEAYRFMRKLAMTQNKKLVDVARATIDLADMFKGVGR
ncbi:nitrate- and nitrite sensing domain-containing protein [Alkalilimnicola ehrlichii MLHE-1]|uniref:Response regulator receiver and ANTAR domain protein n=1 Tax=Alkalilimnicola ehrlichii (strain ATCC BAA-1101 / DSM 17681 / MLHE-1) TaxID=187272 RepID=Q0A7Y3_ALKEH|nr:nitrate- and nitrite sensing domain-containing protein [Alkalilimnicola ehrlichii]ABI57054.1 response regulator receiver and ANTAR domain protein [Alkalilimnicola ehrlichii MLHE-1]